MTTLLDTDASSPPGLPDGDSSPLSKAWFARATDVLAGGISSSARATTTGDQAHPLYMHHGRGSHLWDADGNEFVDYLLSYGSLPLGHTDAGLRDALVARIDLGTMFGTCNTVEVELAEQICRMVPCAELVRFANSGSEAICGAVRAARGFTGRNKILKFEGHYHGWVDVLAVSNRPTPQEAGPAKTPASCPHSRGIPAGVVADVIICPWNDLDALRNILRLHGPELAAVIAEPIVANNACIMPVPDYLDALRDECTRHGILLIFDEIVTGFRIAPGGAQELFGVVPDLAVYSKALGGGLPISAFAGRRAVMELIGRNQVKHGGTYNGNPLCAAGALHTLRMLARPESMSRMRLHGGLLMETIERGAHDLAIPCIVQGLGAMFQVVFGLTSPPRDYRGMCLGNQKRYAAFRDALLHHGVHANSSGMACWFNSVAHTNDDLDITIDAITHALKAIA